MSGTYPTCHGTGARLPTGRRIYNHLHRTWKDSHR